MKRGSKNLKGAVPDKRIHKRNFVTKPPSPRQAKFADNRIPEAEVPKKSFKVLKNVPLSREIAENYSDLGKAMFLSLIDDELIIREAKKTSVYVPSFMQNRKNAAFITAKSKKNKYICFLMDENTAVERKKAESTLSAFLVKEYNAKVLKYSGSDFAELEYAKFLVDEVFGDQNARYNSFYKVKKERKSREIYPISSIINIGENFSTADDEKIKIVGLQQAKEGNVTIEEVMSVDSEHGYKYLKSQKYFVRGTRKKFDKLISYVRVFGGKLYISRDYAERNLSERVKTDILKGALHMRDKKKIEEAYGEYMKNALRKKENGRKSGRAAATESKTVAKGASPRSPTIVTRKGIPSDESRGRSRTKSPASGALSPAETRGRSRSRTPARSRSRPRSPSPARSRGRPKSPSQAPAKSRGRSRSPSPTPSTSESSASGERKRSTSRSKSSNEQTMSTFVERSSSSSRSGRKRSNSSVEEESDDGFEPISVLSSRSEPGDEYDEESGSEFEEGASDDFDLIPPMPKTGKSKPRTDTTPNPREKLPNFESMRDAFNKQYHPENYKKEKAKEQKEAEAKARAKERAEAKAQAKAAAEAKKKRR